MNETSPFASLCSIWLAKIEMAWEQKNKRFGVDARDGMFFYKGPYDKMYDGTYGAPWGTGEGRSNTGPVSSIQPPAVRVTLNKVSDMVQLFGPYLYYKNPNRKVEARKSVVEARL